jgi:hypothetical protein
MQALEPKLHSKNAPIYTVNQHLQEARTHPKNQDPHPLYLHWGHCSLLKRTGDSQFVLRRDAPDILPDDV